MSVRSTINNLIGKVKYELAGGEYGKRQEARARKTPEGKALMDRISRAKWYQLWVK